MNRGRLPPGRLFFLLPTKERTKENCRCFDAADPRLGGCTPPRPPKRKSEGAGAKRTQYYCPFLTPPPLPPLLSRCSPEPPLPETAVRRGRACPARDFAMPLINGQPPPTAKGAGCRPPSPLSSATRPRHPVGAGHARPAALRQLPVSFCIPFIFYIVGRGCGVANRGHG